MMAPPDSLKSHLVRSWILLGGGALLSSAAVIVILVTIGHRGQIARVRDDLAIKAPSIARRLSGELLIGPNGAPEAVARDLMNYHGVSNIQVLPHGETCSSPNTPFCKGFTEGAIYRVEPVPSVVPARSVIVTAPQPKWTASFRWEFLIIGALPVLVMTGIGILLQWRFMRRQLLNPISQLIERQVVEGGNQALPFELQRIADHLSHVLKERDQATARVHLAEAKMHAQEILGRFVSSVLHDISTPVASASMLVDQCPEIPVQKKDEFRRIIGRIRGILSEHRRKLNAFTDAAAISARPDIQAADATCSVGGVARVIAGEFSPRLGELGVALTLDIPSRALIRFARISYSDLSRVVSNLLENAIFAASERGSRVDLRASVSTFACELAFRDYGAGFDPTVLGRIESGEQITTKASGSGQGLLSARKLVESAGGQLRIIPQEDGTLVLVTLPNTPPPRWFTDPGRIPAQSILALDDDLTLQERLEVALPNRKIRLFQSEEDFLQAAQANPEHLLLVDFNYGGLRSGLMLIEEEELKERAILLSGRISFDEQIQFQALSAGVRMCPKECIV
jgi:signal transduction histidine kinase